MTSNRLLIVNNVPAYYRTPVYAAMEQIFKDRTGGDALVAYQFRRIPNERGEWFYTPDEDLTYDHRFVAGTPLNLRGRRVWLQPPGLSQLLRYRPTHVFTAGWSIPLSFAAAQFGALPGRTLGVWVESSPLTSQKQGVGANAVRRQFLRGANFSVAPTEASERYVNDLVGHEVPALRLLNPVMLARLPEESARKDHRRLVFLGDLSRRKGFDRFVDLAAALAPEGYDSVAWGRDTEGLGQSQSVVTLRGALPLVDILPSLSSYDILCIPSRVDPAPLTYSEALALGLRVLVSDSIALREHAERNSGAVVADCGRQRTMVEAVRKLSAEGRPSPELSHEVAPQHFALKVIEQLLGNGG